MKTKALIIVLLIGVAATCLFACAEKPAATGVLALSASTTTIEVDGGSTSKLSSAMASSSEDIKNRTITYHIIEGNATITGDEVRTTPQASVGEKIRVQAQAGNITSNTLELTVVANQSTVLLELELSAPSNPVPAGTVVLSAKKIPSTAVAVVDWVIVSGEEYVETFFGGLITVKENAPIGEKIVVKAYSGEVSATHTITIADPTLHVTIAAPDNQSADYGASSLKTFNVVVIENQTINTTAELIASVAPAYAHLLEARASGRTVELTVKGHGSAKVTLTVEGSNAVEEVDVECIKAPDSLDIPEYVKAAGVYSIGVSSIDITSTDKTMAGSNMGARQKNGAGMDSFTNRYAYKITEGATLPLPVSVIGQKVCTSYTFDTPLDSGITIESGALRFTKAGTWTVVARSTSGSVREATTAFTVNVLENGISVNTFEELRAVGMYGENLDGLGNVRPITLNPVERVGELGYALVPEYLKNKSTIYNKDSGSFTEADFRGMSNCNLTFFGSTRIIGNNVTVDLSRFPVLAGSESFVSGGVPYPLFGENQVAELERFSKGRMMYFKPSAGFLTHNVTLGAGESFTVYEMNKDAVGVAGVDVGRSRALSSIPNYAVDISGFTIRGNWGVMQPTSASTRGVFSRAIEVNGGKFSDMKFANLMQYLYPQCQLTLKNVAVRDFATGMRVSRLAGGSMIEGFYADNLNGGGLQVSASDVTLKDLTFGAIGGAGLELVPEDAELSGDEKPYIESKGVSAVGLTNQRVAIAGDFNLLSSNLNRLNTPAMLDFFALVGSALGNPSLSPSVAVNASFLVYAQGDYAAQNASDPVAKNVISAFGYEMARILAAQVGQTGEIDFMGSSSVGLNGFNLVALYLWDAEPMKTGGLPTPNLTTVAYQLDAQGSTSNEVVKLGSIMPSLLDPIVEAVKAGATTPEQTLAAALPSIVQGFNTTNKYISVQLAFPTGTDDPTKPHALVVGELIMFNPLYQKTPTELATLLTTLLS